MSRCPGCGGVVGRDCFNPVECLQISNSMLNQNSQDIRVNEMTLEMLQNKFKQLLGILERHGIDISELNEPEKHPVNTTYSPDTDDLPF